MAGAPVGVPAVDAAFDAPVAGVAFDAPVAGVAFDAPVAGVAFDAPVAGAAAMVAPAEAPFAGVLPAEVGVAGVLPVAGAWAARGLPVVGMACVAATGLGEPLGVSSGASTSPAGDSVRTEPCVRSLMPVSPSPGGTGRSPARPGRPRCHL